MKQRSDLYDEIVGETKMRRFSDSPVLAHGEPHGPFTSGLDVLRLREILDFPVNGRRAAPRSQQPATGNDVIAVCDTMSTLTHSENIAGS